MAISGISAVSPSAAGLNPASSDGANSDVKTDASGAPVQSTAASGAAPTTTTKKSGVTQPSQGDFYDQAIAQLQKMLAAVMRQVAALRASNMDKDVKAQMMQGLLQQTSAIQGQIQKLMEEKMQALQAGG
jgi:hypothetical protein